MALKLREARKQEITNEIQLLLQRAELDPEVYNLKEMSPFDLETFRNATSKIFDLDKLLPERIEPLQAILQYIRKRQFHVLKKFYNDGSNITLHGTNELQSFLSTKTGEIDIPYAQAGGRIGIQPARPFVFSEHEATGNHLEIFPANFSPWDFVRRINIGPDIDCGIGYIYLKENEPLEAITIYEPEMRNSFLGNSAVKVKKVIKQLDLVS